jgi:hypothetical protein
MHQRHTLFVLWYTFTTHLAVLLLVVLRKRLL